MESGGLRDSGVVDVVDVGAEVWQAVDEHLQLDHAEGRVVEDDHLDRQVEHTSGDELAEQHGQPAIAGDRDHLTTRVRGLGAQGHRQGIGHRPVQERADETAGTQRIDVSSGPHIAHTGVGGEDRILVGHLVEDVGDVLGVDRLHLLDVARVGADRGLHDLGVALDRLLEELVVMLLESGQDGLDEGLDVGADREGDVGATSELLRVVLHLDGEGVGQELVVREVGAQQDEHVGIVHALGGSTIAEQTGHAHVERVVVLDEVLATQRVTDRGLELVRQGQDLVVGTLDTGTGEDGNLPGVVEELGQLLDVLWVGGENGTTEWHIERGRCGGLLIGDVTGQGDDRDGLVGHGVANGAVDDTRCLIGGGDELAVVRALQEETIRVGLLEVVRTDLDAGNVRGDGQHRGLGALGVVQTIDEVKVARAAGTRAHGKLASELSLGGSGEGGCLLVTHVHPVDTALGGSTGLAYGVDDGIERVPDDAVDTAHSRIQQLVDELFGNVHVSPPV